MNPNVKSGVVVNLDDFKNRRIQNRVVPSISFQAFQESDDELLKKISEAYHIEDFRAYARMDSDPEFLFNKFKNTCGTVSSLCFSIPVYRLNEELFNPQKKQGCEVFYTFLEKVFKSFNLDFDALSFTWTLQELIENIRYSQLDLIFPRMDYFSREEFDAFMDQESNYEVFYLKEKKLPRASQLNLILMHDQEDAHQFRVLLTGPAFGENDTKKVEKAIEQANSKSIHDAEIHDQPWKDGLGGKLGLAGVDRTCKNSPCEFKTFPDFSVRILNYKIPEPIPNLSDNSQTARG